MDLQVVRLDVLVLILCTAAEAAEMARVAASMQQAIVRCNSLSKSATRELVCWRFCVWRMHANVIARVNATSTRLIAQRNVEFHKLCHRQAVSLLRALAKRLLCVAAERAWAQWVWARRERLSQRDTAAQMKGAMREVTRATNQAHAARLLRASLWDLWMGMLCMNMLIDRG